MNINSLLGKRKKTKKFEEGNVHYKMKTGDIVFSIINYTVFILFAIICIYPFYYLFINTISDSTLVTKGVITWRPRGLNIEVYKQIFTEERFLVAIRITVLRTVLGTLCTVMASAFIGYLVTKQEMFGRKVLYRIIIVTMYFNAGTIPWYLTMNSLGLTNNFWAYIIPSIVAPYNIILVKTYIESIPAELEESAKMDGASYLRVFSSIILPLSKPILATIAIFCAVGNWNSFMDSRILMSTKTSLRTLQDVLQYLLTQASEILSEGANNGEVSEAATQKAMAARAQSIALSMASILPIVCVYPFFMRFFEKGIMIGAVKG